MTDYRSPAPTIPEIKRMSTSELFIEAARAQSTIAKINTTLAFVNERQPNRPLEKAMDAHQRALHNITAELAARYVTSDADRQAVLFKLMGSVALTCKSYLKEFDSEKDTYHEQEFLRDQMRETLQALDGLR